MNRGLDLKQDLEEKQKRSKKLLAVLGAWRDTWGTWEGRPLSGLPGRQEAKEQLGSSLGRSSGWQGCWNWGAAGL